MQNEFYPYVVAFNFQHCCSTTFSSLLWSNTSIECSVAQCKSRIGPCDTAVFGTFVNIGHEPELLNLSHCISVELAQNAVEPKTFNDSNKPWTFSLELNFGSYSEVNSKLIFRLFSLSASAPNFCLLASVHALSQHGVLFFLQSFINFINGAIFYVFYFG